MFKQNYILGANCSSVKSQRTYLAISKRTQDSCRVWSYWSIFTLNWSSPRRGTSPAENGKLTTFCCYRFQSTIEMNEFGDKARQFFNNTISTICYSAIEISLKKSSPLERCDPPPFFLRHLSASLPMQAPSRLSRYGFWSPRVLGRRKARWQSFDAKRLSTFSLWTMYKFRDPSTSRWIHPWVGSFKRSTHRLKDTGAIPPEELDEVKNQFKEAFGSSIDDVINEANNSEGELGNMDKELLELMKAVLYD